MRGGGVRNFREFAAFEFAFFKKEPAVQRRRKLIFARL